jgi:type III secretion protein V
MATETVARFQELKKALISGNLNETLTRASDLILVTCVALMVGLMIVPLPTFLLDIFLTINITIAVTVLMLSIYISNAVSIASFPTLLLITTLYRLSLDISATRLILLRADAGEVIRSFGQFVVGGNFVVGAVIFLIITLVQFIVITKGSERVAEVAARFTLDALPGKQMSIDADMRSGLIDSQEGRRRRYALARESQFYGAMDGAMKFVKGDAIAGIIITVINIAGGLIIGIGMNGMSVTDALQTYSILTIGSGLVAQIPALLISISAGMVVTRVASEDGETNLGQDIAAQILSQPKAIGVASAVLLVMALVPGLPTIPFLILSAVTGSISYGLFRAAKRAQTKDREAPAALGAEPQITITLPIFIQVGVDLAPSVDLQTPVGQAFYRKLTELRSTLYVQTGIIFPPIQIAANQPRAADQNFVIWLNEVPVARGRVRTDSVLVNSDVEKLLACGITGEETANPATGKPACWIPRGELAAAQAAGFQTWDTHEVLTLHLASFLRSHAHEFIGLQEVQWTLAAIKKHYPALVDEVVPKPVSLQQLTEVLKCLTEAEVSIRDMKAILQCLGEHAHAIRDSNELAERVRVALRRKICFHLTDGKPLLFLYQLDPSLQDLFHNCIRQNANGPYLSMDPESIDLIVKAAQKEISALPPTAQRPAIVTDKEIRRFVKRVLARDFPDLQVLSYEELAPEMNVQLLGKIGEAAAAQIGQGAPWDNPQKTLATLSTASR